MQYRNYNEARGEFVDTGEDPEFDDEGFCTNWISSPGRMLWRAEPPEFEAKPLMKQYGFTEFTDRL